jgi:LuxR family transcriptional regulator, regulator of acetate metabolism
MADATPGPNLDRLLGPALSRLRTATGVDATMAGPVTLAGRRLVVTNLHGLLTSTMHGLVVTPGVGIGGKALQMARPVAVNDYLHSTAVSHHFDHKVAQEHIHGAFAVPVRVGRNTHAVLYGLTRTAQPLGDRVLATAASVAAGLGREMTIEVEVFRRLRTIEQQRQQRQRRDRTTTDFREIREELLSIAQDTSDQLLRDRLIGICDRMAAQITPSRTPTPLLTCRERDVLTRIALGHTNLEVAEQLSIMPTTVKTYLKNTMRKLGTRNRVQTIHAARRAGLLK